MADQIEANGTTAETVADAFDGKTLNAAHMAFWRELADFFLDQGRPDRADAVRKQAKVLATAIQAAQAKIETLDPDELVARHLPTPGEPSTSSPAASA